MKISNYILVENLEDSYKIKLQNIWNKDTIIFIEDEFKRLDILESKKLIIDFQDLKECDSIAMIYLISNILFFNILKKHGEWIINNGIFADYKGEKSFIEKTTEKIQTIKKEPTNTADELLKWAELKEKGLITDEEFQKGKEKILEGKL